MKVGYCRISTEAQNLDLQVDALKGAGCEKIFQDTICGARTDRPGLAEALSFVRPGDTLVVWRLDRLGRSLKHLIETITQLESRQVSFKSLHEMLDTSTSGGRLVFHIFGALSEFERSLILERTRAGLAAARSRGRVGGRPKILDENRADLAQRLHAEKKHTIREICDMVGISRTSLYDYLKLSRHALAATTARSS